MKIYIGIFFWLFKNYHLYPKIENPRNLHTKIKKFKVQTTVSWTPLGFHLPFTRFLGLLLGLIVLAAFWGLPFGIAGINFSRVGEISRAISSDSTRKNYENPEVTKKNLSYQSLYPNGSERCQFLP